MPRNLLPFLFNAVLDLKEQEARRLAPLLSLSKDAAPKKPRAVRDARKRARTARRKNR